MEQLVPFGPFSLPSRPRRGTLVFDRSGTLWLTGQNGIYGWLDPPAGALQFFDAPGGAGPDGSLVAPDGSIDYASLAGSFFVQIDPASGRAPVLDPPTPGQRPAGLGRFARPNLD